MNRTRVLQLLAGLTVTTLLAGCHLPAAPAVTPTPSQAEADALMPELEPEAEANAATAAAMTQSPLPSPTPEPTSEVTPPPTTLPATSPTSPVTAAPTQPVAAQPSATPTPTPLPAGTGSTYVVQPGDNLFRIALRFGLRFEDLAAHNGIVNPHRIYVGQVIRIPSGSTQSPQPVPGETRYTVKAGDNLFRIALRYNLNYLYLAQYNGIANPHRILVGQVLRIPTSQ